MWTFKHADQFVQYWYFILITARQKKALSHCVIRRYSEDVTARKHCSPFNYLSYRPVNNYHMLTTDDHFEHRLKIIHLKEHIYLCHIL